MNLVGHIPAPSLSESPRASATTFFFFDSTSLSDPDPRLRDRDLDLDLEPDLNKLENKVSTQNRLCILYTPKKNDLFISSNLILTFNTCFQTKITFVNSQHTPTNSKSYLVVYR